MTKSPSDFYLCHTSRVFIYPHSAPQTMQNKTCNTVESLFLEPPRETKIGSRNREFEKSKVASKDAKLLRYCFIRGNHAHFRSNRWEMADLSLAV